MLTMLRPKRPDCEESCLSGLKHCSDWLRLRWNGSGKKGIALALPLCALILLASGCAGSAALTGGTNKMTPAPRTPGAIITDEYICIPHDEAAELMLWIERAETL